VGCTVVNVRGTEIIVAFRVTVERYLSRAPEPLVDVRDVATEDALESYLIVRFVYTEQPSWPCIWRWELRPDGRDELGSVRGSDAAAHFMEDVTSAFEDTWRVRPGSHSFLVQDGRLIEAGD
jgi:hypothetical protein